MVDSAAIWQGLQVEQTEGSGRLHKLPSGKENDAKVEVVVAVLTPAWGKKPKGIGRSSLTPNAQVKERQSCEYFLARIRAFVSWR